MEVDLIGPRNRNVQKVPEAFLQVVVNTLKARVKFPTSDFIPKNLSGKAVNSKQYALNSPKVGLSMHRVFSASYGSQSSLSSQEHLLSAVWGRMTNYPSNSHGLISWHLLTQTIYSQVGIPNFLLLPNQRASKSYNLGAIPYAAMQK